MYYQFVTVYNEYKNVALGIADECKLEMLLNDLHFSEQLIFTVRPSRIQYPQAAK